MLLAAALCSVYGLLLTDRTGSKMGISPLMLAAMNGHTAAVKLLLDMGSDVNAQVRTHSRSLTGNNHWINCPQPAIEVKSKPVSLMLIICEY